MKTMEPIFECNEIVVKIASRCNINCTYCYMYNKGDNSYLKQPKFMHPDVYKAMFSRIKTHCDEKQLNYFALSIHGGEPLLAGKKYLREFVETGRSILNGIHLILALQTNGILIDKEWCDLFEELGIEVGISIDVSEHAHNKYRVDHKGKGTYPETLVGLNIAKEHPYGKRFGALAVIDINTDPAGVYDHFKALNITSLDLLLPDNNYNDLPTGMNSNYDEERKKTPYANWLIPVFNRWMEDNNRIGIRMFSLIVNLILGKKTGNDQIGAEMASLLVIETDGGIEPVDHMKICGPEFTKLGLNVLQHELKEISKTDLYQKFFHAKTRLPVLCQHCAISNVCGGGLFATRYSHTTEFDNPSVYCLDLLKLITHVQNTVLDHFTLQEIEQLGIERLSYEDALRFMTDRSSEFMEVR